MKIQDEEQQLTSEKPHWMFSQAKYHRWGAMDKGKLGHKWTHKRVDKARDEIINKTYAEYKQCELNEKGKKKTGKALGKHVINLYSTGIS